MNSEDSKKKMQKKLFYIFLANFILISLWFFWKVCRPEFEQKRSQIKFVVETLNTNFVKRKNKWEWPQLKLFKYRNYWIEITRVADNTKEHGCVVFSGYLKYQNDWIEIQPRVKIIQSSKWLNWITTLVAASTKHVLFLGFPGPLRTLDHQHCKNLHRLSGTGASRHNGDRIRGIPLHPQYRSVVMFEGCPKLGFHYAKRRYLSNRKCTFFSVADSQALLLGHLFIGRRKQRKTHLHLFANTI